MILTRWCAGCMDMAAPGSYLAIAHAASDIRAEAVTEHARQYNQRSSAPITLRSREQIARFFDGLDVTGRGLVPLADWWAPDGPEAGRASGLPGYCGIAMKR